MAYTAPSVATSSTTFAQLQAGGLSSVLETLITVNGGGTAAPTAAPTLAASGSGGTLPAATYYVVLTETNGIGETTASPASGGQAVTLGQNLVITPPSLKSGNVARNYYVGTSSAGPFLRAGTGSTASTFTISAPLQSSSYAEAPPTVNSTGFTYLDANGNTLNYAVQNIRSFKQGNFASVYKNAAKLIDDFLRGDPQTFSGAIAKIRHVQVAVASLNQALTDIGTLLDANPGHIYPSLSGGTGTVPSSARTWP